MHRSRKPWKYKAFLGSDVLSLVSVPSDGNNEKLHLQRLEKQTKLNCDCFLKKYIELLGCLKGNHCFKFYSFERLDDKERERIESERDIYPLA